MSRTSLVLLVALMCVTRMPAQETDSTKDSPTDKEFSLEVEEGGNNKTETTLKLIVTTKGPRQCTFRIGESSIKTTGKPVAGMPDQRRMEVLVKLELMGTGDRARVLQSLKIGPGQIASSQSQYPALGVESTEKLIIIEAKTGRFALKKKLKLGVIRGEPLTLTVD